MKVKKRYVFYLDFDPHFVMSVHACLSQKFRCIYMYVLFQTEYSVKHLNTVIRLYQVFCTALFISLLQ